MDAEGATKAVPGAILGATPSTATNRVEGTKRSVYLAASSDAPMESKAFPIALKAL